MLQIGGTARRTVKFTAWRARYTHTLRAWYERFKANEEEVVRLYDRRFYRLYSFYLAASMTMFSDGAMIVYQLQYLRSRYAAPVMRDYMLEDEKRLRAAEPAPITPTVLS